MKFIIQFAKSIKKLWIWIATDQRSITNKDLSIMGSVTDHLRSQGEKRWLDFCKENNERIKKRFQLHWDSKTTLRGFSKSEREKMIFEYSVGEIYLRGLSAVQQEALVAIGLRMHRRLRDWMRMGFMIGVIAICIFIFLIK